MGVGIAAEIARRWPDLFKAYHKYCGLFQPNSWDNKNHYDELLGTFFTYKVRNDLLVCNAFAQEGVSHTQCMTDYDAWQKIFKKIEYQTRAINKRDNCNWTIHCPYKMGCGHAGGDWETMMSLIRSRFDNSPVEFVIHRY